MKKEVKVIQIKLFSKIFVIYCFSRDSLANLSGEKFTFQIKGENVNNCKEGGNK